MKTNPKIHVGGIDIEWDQEKGLNLWSGAPAMTAWIESTMAGLLSTMQRIAGTERYQLAMQGGGRDSIEGDWGIISSAPTFEEGFALLAGVAAAAGWGRWEIVSIDRSKQEAIVRVYNNWESIAQRSLGVSWGSSFIAGKLAGYFQRVFSVPACWADQTLSLTDGDEYDEFIIRPSKQSIEDRVAEHLAAEEFTKVELAAALEQLRKEVEERARTERELREKLDVIARQEEAIKALSTPIIEVWEGVLTLPLFGVLDSQRAAETMERLLEAITSKSATYAIIDLTGIEVVDTSTADHISKLAKAAELLGARCIITGIRPAVAQTMVQIGIDLTKLVTLSTLREALQQSMRWKSEEPRKKR